MKKIFVWIMTITLMMTCVANAATISYPHYIANWSFEYNEQYEDYELRFMLKDANQQSKGYDTTVSFYACDENHNMLTDAKGQPLFKYEKECLASEDFYTVTYRSALYSGLNGTYCIIAFDPKDMPTFPSATGTIALDVTGFETIYIDVTDFPVAAPIIKSPKAPTDYLDNRYSGSNTKVTFTAIECTYTTTYSGSKIEFKFTGEVTGKYGNSSYMYIGYQITDSEGYMIDKGYMSIKVPDKGQKFKNQTDTIYLDEALEGGKTYTIEFIKIR